MNCRRFQNDLYEYLDGALSSGARAAAEKHLADCPACRQRLAQERQVGRFLSDSFRRSTEPLQLPPSVGRQVMAALAVEPSGAGARQTLFLPWRRLAWTLPLAASLSLLLGIGLLWVRGPAPPGPRPQPRTAERVVTVQLSYIVPIYTFRQEHGAVMDALTYRTNIVNQRLQTELARPN
jgi:anti-sigma factor RsiW